MLMASADQAFHAGLLLTALGFGFRHGVDWDHIGALTDLTSSQDQPRRAMWFATLYALGHALVVFVLGFGAIMLAAQVPSGIDSSMERFVGATLIILAVYVFYSLGRHGGEFRMRSRWMLLITAVRTGLGWARGRARTDGVDRQRHRHVAGKPDRPFGNYAPHTAFGIGMIHGIGAETPTQMLILLTAAEVDAKAPGLLLLACSLVGLLAANTVVALAGTAGLVGVRGNRHVYVAVSLCTALCSGAIGIVFLVGSSSSLPGIPGG